MFHPIFEALCRKKQAELISAEYKLDPDNVKDRIKQIGTGPFEDAMVKARVKCNCSLPSAAYDDPNQTVEEKSKALFDGHILKELETWLESPQGQTFLKVMSLIISIILGLAVVGT